MQIFMALLAGLIFGIGLIVSGMANPAKVIGFLDLRGNWDPSLAFVMGGAICVGLVAFSAAARRSKTCLLYTSPSPRDRQKSRMPSSA